jgi:hypothetical protein
MQLDDVPSVPWRTGVCASSLPDWICPTLDVVAAILSSPFVLSLLGAAAGAGVGALVALRLVARRQRREELAAEIRSTNVATMVALSIVQKALRLKRTHVLPLAARFSADIAGWNEFQRQRRTGQRQGNVPPPILIDGSAVVTLSFPIATLQHLLFEKIAMFGRSLALTSTVSETSGWLVNANAKRNALIDQIRQLPSAAGVPELYFGAPSSSGVANPEYAETVSAVVDHTDELIFFSATLATDLEMHARQLRGDWVKEFGPKNVPEIAVADLGDARQEGLIPEGPRFAKALADVERQVLA